MMTMRLDGEDQAGIGFNIMPMPGIRDDGMMIMMTMMMMTTILMMFVIKMVMFQVPEPCDEVPENNSGSIFWPPKHRHLPNLLRPKNT